MALPGRLSHNLALSGAKDPFKPLPRDLSGPMEDSLSLSSSEYYGNWWVIYVIQKPRAEQ